MWDARKKKTKTKTAFYLACKNPAKMDTTKKDQKKITEVEKKNQN